MRFRDKFWVAGAARQYCPSVGAAPSQEVVEPLASGAADFDTSRTSLEKRSAIRRKSVLVNRLECNWLGQCICRIARRLGFVVRAWRSITESASCTCRVADGTGLVSGTRATLSVFQRGAWEHCVAMLLVLATFGSTFAQNWDRFRGPNGAGLGEASGVPTEWQAENIIWRKALPGIGHSSPVVWGERLFVMSANAETGQQIVEAYDALGGERLWQTAFDGPTYGMHARNSFASSTPAVDEQHVYAMWLGSEGVTLTALTHDGEEVWRRVVGPFVEVHGFGKSPVVVDEMVIVANDSEAESAVVAFDRTTGDERWRIARPSGTTAFATPCLFDAPDGRKLLATASTAAGITLIDVEAGQVAYQTDPGALPVRCVASPVVGQGLVLASCGDGGSGKLLLAVKPGEGAHLDEVYRLRERVPQVPTPLVAGELLFLWHDRGIVSCFDVATGKLHWRERIGGDYSSSPVLVDGRLFGISYDGEVIVLAAGTKYRLLARNQLGEATRATPAVAHNRMYLRTEKSLMCIGAKEP